MGVTGGGGNSGECRGGYIMGAVPAPAPRMRPWGAPKHLEQIPTGLVLTWAPSLSFPSAWWHRLRVSHLHPAGGHDISEVGGTGGAQRPHHAVRGASRAPVPTDLSELSSCWWLRWEHGSSLLKSSWPQGLCLLGQLSVPLLLSSSGFSSYLLIYPKTQTQTPAFRAAPAGESL